MQSLTLLNPYVNIQILCYIILVVTCPTCCNLIKDGDFQNYVLLYSLNYPFVGKHSLETYNDSWYRLSDRSKVFQISNYGNSTEKQGLDLIKGVRTTQMATCQDFVLQIDREYFIEFQYLVDYPQPKFFAVKFNDQLLLNITTESTVPIKYSIKITATQIDNNICFFGNPNLSNTYLSSGVFIDNVNIFLARVSQNITFTISEDWESKILTLSSDYTIDPAKIQSFNETLITVGGIQLPLLNLSLGAGNTLQFIADLNVSLNYSFLEISIMIPDYVYIDINGSEVKFIISKTYNDIMNSEEQQQISQKVNDQQLYQQTTDQQQANDQQRQNLIDIVAKFMKTVRAIGLLGFTAIIFRFISFANIYILYIFLDIGYLNSTIRANLNQFADILLGRGLISSFSQFVIQTEIDLSFFKIETTEKLPATYTTKGSSLHVINISTNLFETCFEDLVVMIANCLTIFLLWLALKKLKRFENLREFINNHFNKRYFQNCLLIEVISVAPVWTLTSALGFTIKCDFSSQNLSTKINQGVFILFPLIFLVAWFPMYLIFLKKKLTNSMKNQQRASQHILCQQKRKYVYIYNKIERIQVFNSLFFVFFGFLIGAQNTLLFFVIATLYKITIIILLFRRRELSLNFFARMIQILIKSTIHFSFLILSIVTKLAQSNIFYENALERCSQIISVIILYSFLCGIAFQALILVAGFLEYVVCLIKKLNKGKQEQEGSPQIQQMKKKIGLKNNRVYDSSHKKQPKKPKKEKSQKILQPESTKNSSSKIFPKGKTNLIIKYDFKKEEKQQNFVQSHNYLRKR